MQHPVHVRRAVRTTLALQQLARVRLAAWASNQIDTPRLTKRTVKTETLIYQPRPTSAIRNDRPAVFTDSTDTSYPQRSSSCTSTSRPTSATRNDHPAASYDSTIPVTNITHLAEDKYNCYGLYMTINCHLCCIGYLAFVSFIVFDCHYSHGLT